MTPRTFVSLKTESGTLYVNPDCVQAVVLHDKPGEGGSAFVYLGADRAVAVKESGKALLAKLNIKE